MPNTTLAVDDRANAEPPFSTNCVGEGPDNPSTGKRWTAGLLWIVGTLALVFLLPPGPRSDPGGLAALLDNISAAGIQDWILSFGALSPVVYFGRHPRRRDPGTRFRL